MTLLNREGTLSPTLSNRLLKYCTFAYDFGCNWSSGFSSTRHPEICLLQIWPLYFGLHVFQLLENRLLKDCNFAYMFLKCWKLGYCSIVLAKSTLCSKAALIFYYFQIICWTGTHFSIHLYYSRTPIYGKRRSADFCPVDRDFSMAMGNFFY